MKILEIGEIIKEARIAKGLTQQELGDIIGVQKSAIAKYESGKVVNIKRKTLQKLAVALDLRGSDLVSDLISGEPTAGDDGLTLNQLKLIEFAKSVPEDKAEMILKVIRSIVEAD